MQSRAQLIEVNTRARVLSDGLFAIIRPDSYYERPIPERHRFIFYLGHMEAFDWNLICGRTVGVPSPHKKLDDLFAFGIDPPSGKLPQDKPADWPSVEEVHLYNRKVRQALDPLLKEVPDQVLHVATEHRLMHVETMSYILHNLDLERKRIPPLPLETAGPVPMHEMIVVPEGTSTLGCASQEGFRWDNECEPQVVNVSPFAISKYKVTNRQFIQFVEDGGLVPHFWTRHGEQWCWRAMGGEIPLPLDWPVYVTWDLAWAYAKWAGKALPTEEQFHRAAYGTCTGEERQYPWGNEPPDSRRGNFNCRGWDPVPVTAFPLGDSAFGVSQLVGNGWEWTSTAFAPFGGFQPFPFYPGYSAPFFDGAHYVVKGGSAQTAAPLLRRSFRNWFRGGYPYVYAGFRCVDQ